jgi:hypothetical protein
VKGEGWGQQLELQMVTDRQDTVGEGIDRETMLLPPAPAHLYLGGRTFTTP